MTTSTQPIKLLELHEIKAKAMSAQSESARIKRTEMDTNYIQLAINQVTPHLDNDTCDEIFDEEKLGIFLFHENKRYTVTEVWLAQNGEILEVNRTTKRIKTIKHRYAFKNYGINKFVNAIGEACDAITEKKKFVFSDNQDGIEKIDRLLQSR